MQLSDLIYKAGIIETRGSTHLEISDVVFDSRQASDNALYVAIRGYTTDGHQYIDQAIAEGAKAVICEEIPEKAPPGITFIRVVDARKALAMVACNLYEHPSEHLKLVGVTGTNGKTTVATLLYEVFTSLGYPCGLISTNGILLAGEKLSTSHTTPDALTINRLLSQMASAGCSHVFMEVSSHALHQSRVGGLRFGGAIFTNLTQDHLDYHPSVKEYIQCKSMLFNQLPDDSFALTNLDDKNGLILVQNTAARVYTYSLRAMADFKGRMLENSFAGLHLDIDKNDVWCQLTGRFNAYNILAVYAAGRILEEEAAPLLTAISECKPPEGRFQVINGNNKVKAIVDYAHTPDALKNVLETINEIRTGNESLITVIGCGGNRDKGKRGPMAVIAASLSDKVIFTSDNPRYEAPEAIIADMEKGLDLDPSLKSKYVSITDREKAINVACVMAHDGDIVLVAGKGHEKTQEIRGEKKHFDDKTILMNLLNR